MSSHAVEPGTRLVARYRLDKHLGDVEGTSYWRAVDELLDRPVGVTLLAAGSDHADRVLRAARLAAAVSDPRFLRVLDAAEVDGVVYVVNEWVRATNLVDLLGDGPLPAGEARDLTVDIAEALDVAHRDGLAHLCLRPEHVLRTTHGQVKIVGLAVEAAVQRVDLPDGRAAAQRDARSAAAVGYAALTGRWPAGGAEDRPVGLPPAPHDGTGLCSPRQVRAGVPHDLDIAVSRALGVPGVHETPLRTPGELAQALADAHVTTRVPVVRPAQERSASVDGQLPPHLSAYDDQGPRRAGRTTMLAWGVVVLVLVVGLALAGSQLVLTALGGNRDQGDQNPSRPSSSPSDRGRPTGAPLRVERVVSFDPEGDGEENPQQAGLVADGKNSTVWISNYYNDPFGPTGLKDGVGLVLDLGSPKPVEAVKVRTVGGSTDLEVRTSDQLGTSLDDFAPMGDPARGVDGPGMIRPTEQVRARYVLVWLTSLPVDGSVYRGRIAEITVYS